MLFVGDDWAEDHHDIEVQDDEGRRLLDRIRANSQRAFGSSARGASQPASRHNRGSFVYSIQALYSAFGRRYSGAAMSSTLRPSRQRDAVPRTAEPPTSARSRSSVPVHPA